jgi:hypothetical protein
MGPILSFGSQLAELGVAGGFALGSQTAPDSPKADVTIHMSTVELGISRRRMIKTTRYKGSAPGTVLRLPERVPPQLHYCLTGS